MSNYTILQQNVLGSLETDDAISAFLWACYLPGADRFHYKAEAFAREVDLLAVTVWHALETAKRACCSVLSYDKQLDLFTYVMERHSFHRFPKNKRSYVRDLLAKRVAQ